MNIIEGGVCAAKGFLASGIHCGIRKNKGKRDLALIYSEAKCAAAAVYTQNKTKGAPIVVTRENIADGHAKAVICNSGIANVCTADGIEKAQSMCDAVAKELDIASTDVIVASTGVIGMPLPIEPIQKGMPQLVKELSPNGGAAAAEGIMTTDLIKKEIAVSFDIGGVECKMGGIAKGSGMIHPNMATTLCFVTTDAAVSPAMLDAALREVVADTFNMISVDGDTSTSDMLSVLANGLAGNQKIESKGKNYEVFTAALMAVCRTLAILVARDGEGATKLIECNVSGAPSVAVARSAAKSVIASSLVKTMIFGADANAGRILCALGYAEGEFDINKVAVSMGSSAGKISVCKDGIVLAFSEEKAKEILVKDEITIDIDLGAGEGQATAWGCDLTYDYVKINGDYRS